MKRFYYIADDLNDLSHAQSELQRQGVTTPQIHVLSWDDAEVERRHLHEVEAVLKKDVVRSTQKGAVVGAAAAALVLLVAYLSGAASGAAGWTPFVSLAIVALGFCTWEGGFFGIQQPHHQFRRFLRELNNGKHVFFVDLYPWQEAIMRRIVNAHPGLKPAGDDESTPAWVVQFQNRWHRFVEVMP